MVTLLLPMHLAFGKLCPFYNIFVCYFTHFGRGMLYSLCPFTIYGLLNTNGIFKLNHFKTNNSCIFAQVCHCNATVVCSIPTRGNELLFINIFIISLWYQGNASAMKKIYGKWETEQLLWDRSILRLGS